MISFAGLWPIRSNAWPANGLYGSEVRGHEFAQAWRGKVCGKTPLRALDNALIGAAVIGVGHGTQTWHGAHTQIY